MKNQRFVFRCLAGLLFMAFVGMNITISKSYQVDQMAAKLTLTELAAMAQNGDECVYDLLDCLPTGCTIWSWGGIGGGVPANNYKWQYTGCTSHCSSGGSHCCYELAEYGCQ
ncbi:MAG TPA: hypothetical protein VKZ54_07290 [Membranihabitans sp.]|nr:hypothetical protein [Membranihabitans sp.]